MDGTDKSEVKSVEDVKLPTTQVPGARTVTNVSMAENITADMPQETVEDASEIVNAIIADVTTAAVSAAATSTASMETDDMASVAVTTDVIKKADPKVCTDRLASSDASKFTDDIIDKDVKASMAGNPTAIQPGTAQRDVKHLVAANKDITDHIKTDTYIKVPAKEDVKITESVTANKDITDHIKTDTDIKVPATEDVKITESVTANKDITDHIKTDTDIKVPATEDVKVTESVTANKDITDPVTTKTDTSAAVVTDKVITEPIMTNTNIGAPVTAVKDMTDPITSDKNITESIRTDITVAVPVATVKDTTELVTSEATEKKIAASSTANKDIESVTSNKDIAESSTAESKSADKDVISSVIADKDITETVKTYKDGTTDVTAGIDIIKPVTTDITTSKDIATSVRPDPGTTRKDITYPVMTNKDMAANDTSLDCSNMSLPSFLESKSSAGDKFTGDTPECSFEKPQCPSAISSVDNSKETPVIPDTHADQKVMSAVDEKQCAPELNMQRPFRNIGVSENNSFSSDVGNYMDGGVQSVSSHQSTPSELPSSSSSKDLILMSLAKDAMSTPDDSLQESRNVDNIEITQLIEDATSVSMSMDVDRDASLAEVKEHFGDDLPAAVPVDGEQATIVDKTPSSADDSLMSKDSVDKPEHKEGDEQSLTKTPTQDVPEEPDKSETSGKEANVDQEGDVEMVEEKPSEASGEGDKPGNEGDGSEKGDDADKKDAKSKSAKKRRSGINAETEDDEENEDHTMPASKLIEYQWPQEKGCEWYMLQEQVTEYLDIVSFKRKYPDLHRRPVEVKEKLYLLESNIAVSEMQCDLGLTALKSDQVHELMARDYPDKFKEYAVVLQARERQKITDHHKGYELPTIDKAKLTMYMKKAVKSAAEYNSMFMKEKREERKAYFDLQTNEVHYPRQQKHVLPKEITRVGSYPVSLIPGQFQDYYKKYTSQELKYFPMNTALYNPPRPLKSLYPDPNQPSEEETEEEAKSGSSGKGENDSSSSSSSSDGSSDSSDSDKGGATSGDSDLPLKAPTPKSTRKPRTKASKPAWEVTSPSLALLWNAVEQYSSPGKEEPDVPCNICKGGPKKNRAGKAEDLVKCSECSRYAHPSCLDLAAEMVPVIKTYPWQCMECKTCVKCMEPFDEDQMMFCDHCDRGYHTYCVGVRSIPMGRWECPSCHHDEPPKPKRVRRR